MVNLFLQFYKQKQTNMKKSIIVLALQLIIIVSAFGQTISKPPIYKSHGLTIKHFQDDDLINDAIIFYYQDSRFKHISRLIDFHVEGIDECIAMFDKMITILDMPKTGKDEHISDQVQDVIINRYGFNQKLIYAHQSGQSSRIFSRKEILEIRDILLRL